MEGISETFMRHGIPARVQGFPGVFHVALGVTSPIESYRDMFATDRTRYIKFTTAALERGVRALERGAWFLSATHTEEVIARTLEIVDASAAAIVAERD